MAQRHATRRYTDTLGFLKDWQEQLSMDALLFASGALEDTPAAEMKVDLVLPGGARAGPIVVQLINRFPDGSSAFRVLDLPRTVQEAGAAAMAEKDKWKAYLLGNGELSTGTEGGPELAAAKASLEAVAGEAGALRERLQRTEVELSRARAAAQSAGSRSAGSQAPAAGETTRGLTVPEVGHLPVWATGKLGDNTLRDAFMRLSVEKPTGLLTLALADGRTRWAFLQKGGPVGFRSEPLDSQEVLGVLLFKAGNLTKENLAESLEVMEARGCRQGEALIEMGVFTFAQLVLVLQKQCEFVFTRPIAEKSGTWTIHTFEELPERFIAPPMRVAAHLFRDLRVRAKTLAAEELASFLRPKYDQYVYVRAGVDRTLEEMRMTPDEQAFMKIVGGTSFRVRELPSVSNLSRGATASMLWCLTELNLLDFRGDQSNARTEVKAASLIASRKATIDKGSYFDQLEVHWMCTEEDVEKAWKRFNQDFPADQPGKYGPALEADVKRIIQGMKVAYDTLSNTTKRREYRLTKIEKVMVEQSAMMLASRGDMLMMKESMAEAWDCFSKAAELMPNVGEYRAGLERTKSGRQ